jgi:hypothetical protein
VSGAGRVAVGQLIQVHQGRRVVGKLLLLVVVVAVEVVVMVRLLLMVVRVMAVLDKQVISCRGHCG